MINASTVATRRALEKLFRAIEDEAKRTLDVGLHLAETAARGSEAWKDKTGETRKSITSGSSGGFFGYGISGFVEAGGAAVFLENGTLPHAIYARRAKALRFIQNGAVVFRRWVNHPGTHPTYFLREAAEEAAEWLSVAMPAAIARTIARHGF